MLSATKVGSVVEPLDAGRRADEPSFRVDAPFGLPPSEGLRTVTGSDLAACLRMARTRPPGPDLGGTDSRTTNSWSSSRSSDYADLTSTITAPENDNTRRLGMARTST